ncbi:AMP-binding protein [Streptomyces sp. LP05-1]|uniref:AMP-binding protein n=1 Tax=Streptomyces pyxinae TaxID=2970734 RepID=A0ABT2CK03_9ACTN|nr:AMP-binding protein [Streptomyces sp. LP05-1]MCS0637750.1 AMP-binding protein [Streptomyces sp. LP05-1]
MSTSADGVGRVSHVSHAGAVLAALGEDPGREALVHGERRFTAGEFRDLVHRLARALEGRGAGRGDGVTLLCGNAPETIAVRYAAHLLGCRITHLYGGLAAEAQAALVRDVETRFLVAGRGQEARAAELTALVPGLEVLALGSSAAGPDLLEPAARESAEPFTGRAGPEDICVVRHTGGTTGHPKAIRTTFAQLSLWYASLPGPRSPGDRLLVCTTLAHAVGLLTDAVLGSGGTVVLQEGFDAGAVLAAVERERITHLFLLPPMLYELLDHPAADRTDTSGLRAVLYGGCQASPARLADAVRRFGPVLVQFYGQNEAGGISVLTPEDHDPERPDRLRSAGRVLPGVEVAVRDPAGHDLPPGEHGEICVRSPQMMTGYWKRPELTAEVLRDGWVHTGDIGFLDDDGYLTIVDRLKDMIVVVGGHVYTTELEDLLNSHPGVSRSAVFGVLDEDRVERVHAAVVRAPGGGLTEREIRAWVRRRRGPMYEPARVTWLDTLPLTPTGKPDKILLRDQALTTARPDPGRHA